MSSLFGLLRAGGTGLRAQSFGMSVAAQNAQNASTEGYSRRDVRLSPIAPPPAGGGGVRAGGSRRVIDPYVEARVLGASADRAEASSREQALSMLDGLLSETEGGIAASLDDFEVAVSELTSNPSDPGTRQLVLDSADRLSAAFVRGADSLDAQREEIDARIEGEVQDVNRLLHSIAALGGEIKQAEVTGAEASDLRDQRDSLVRDLAEKVPVKVVQEEGGGVSVLLGASLSLVDPDGNVSELGTATDAAGRTTVTRNTAGVDQDVTELIDSGSVGGFIHARDGALTDAQQALDQLSFDIANAYNAVHTAGFGTDGSGGRNLFAVPTGVPGAARSMAISIDVVGQPEAIAAATDPALTAGDNRNALALASLSDANFASGGTASAQEALGSMIAQAGIALSRAELDVSVTSDAAAQMDAMRASVSGVSVDDEMIALSAHQRAYSASLRVVQAADRMLEELVNLGR